MADKEDVFIFGLHAAHPFIHILLPLEHAAAANSFTVPPCPGKSRFSME
jgi:hypothetical protein